MNVVWLNKFLLCLSMLIKFVPKITTGLLFNRESDRRQAVNTRLSSPSEASVITKPHRVVKKKVTILTTVNLVHKHVPSRSVSVVRQR